MEFAQRIINIGFPDHQNAFGNFKFQAIGQGTFRNKIFFKKLIKSLSLNCLGDINTVGHDPRCAFRQGKHESMGHISVECIVG